MIRSTVHDLRDPQWREVCPRTLRRRYGDWHREDGEETTVSVIPWQRVWSSGPIRSYIVLLSDGAIYAVFIRRVYQ